MKLWIVLGFAFLQLSLRPVWAGKLELNPTEFDTVRPLLCNTETMEQLNVIKKLCEPGSFTIWSEDLNGDGKPERLFFGPSGLCGAHGNCPLVILKESNGRWDFLTQPPCQGNDCLGWANDFATEVLSDKHNGFRDLLIGEDSGSFYWTKSVYQWDGNQYMRKPGTLRYYLADSNGKLKPVSKTRWEQCSRNGKNCL